MAIQTAIEWAQASWNPWRGCTKVSPGCQKCYMFREQRRYGRDPEAVVRTTPTTFNAPLRWWKAWQRGERDPRKALPPGAGIFACSWSDWLHADADPWRAEAYEIIKATPYVYMILTKRPERIADCLPADWGSGWPNVWLGVSAERQHEADQRIPILLTVPTVVRWVSAEPLLGPLDLSEYLKEQTNVTEERGGFSLSSGGDGGTGNRQSGPSVASSRSAGQSLDTQDSFDSLRAPKSREIVRAIFPGTGDDQSGSRERYGPPPDLASFSRPDPDRHDGEPQEWKQDRQPAGQLGIGDLFRATTSLNPGARLSTRTKLSWVITGGESDLKAPRPFDLAWARSIRDQCQAAGVAFFHKQNGGARKIDGAWGGRLLDGRTWDEFPVEAAKAVADRFDLLELQ